MSSKKEKKRTPVFENMVESIAQIEKRSAVWRKVDSRTMLMTVLMQKFSHNSGVETIIKYLCPWGGMKEAIMKFFLESRCLNKNVLPVKVKEDHPQLTSEAYDKKEWAISVANTGTNKPEKLDQTPKNLFGTNPNILRQAIYILLMQRRVTRSSKDRPVY